MDSPRALHEELELQMIERADLLVVLTFDDRPLKLGVEGAKLSFPPRGGHWSSYE